MKVLWLCNIMLPVIADYLGLPASNKEGWLSGLSSKLTHYSGRYEAPVLHVCFPIAPAQMTEIRLMKLPKGVSLRGNVLSGETSGITFFGFPEDTSCPEIYDAEVEKYLARIIRKVKPDVVHCFGTEYPHTLAMTRAFHKPKQTLIGIQGLCSVYADAYMADMPPRIQRRVSLRDFLKQDNLRQQQEKFRIRGKYEIEALQNCAHVTGRTDWDLEWTSKINPKAKYHFMNETLRSNFYDYKAKWTYGGNHPFSIFVSQGNYPIKGLHYLLWALPYVLKKYPDTHVYVAGDNIAKRKTLFDMLKLSNYAIYLKQLMLRDRTRHAVTFLGRLNADEMREQYLKCHVFVSPSAIENSPNSVGEAMLLGVPVISSDVGGVHNMLKDGKEGWLYEKTDTDALVEKICYVFDEANRANVLATGLRASVHAAKTHNAQTNYRRLLEIYREIAGVTDQSGQKDSE